MYTFSSLKEYLDTVLIREKVPGFDCKVLHKGKEVFRYYAGYSDKESEIKMKGDEMYFIYSASKLITCAAALHAFEEGKFLMNHPLWWYIGEFRNSKVRVKNPDGSETLESLKKEIYIRDLFAMTAGLNYDTSSNEIKEAVKKNGKAPTLEVVRAIASMPFDYEPGERWQYSLCHDVLAGLVEVATGVKFSEYVKKVIFDPLGMNDSYYHPTPEILNRMAKQYSFNHPKGYPEPVEKKNAYVFGEEYDSGGAGVITTIDDYAKFAYALTNYGVGANGSRILSKATVNLMRTNILNESEMKGFKDWATNAEYGYGYGVRTKIEEGRGGNLCSMGEFGWDGAAGFMVSIDPEKELTILYAQHMLNPHNHVIHPKIKNFVNQIIE